jgi:dTDP-glucose 4,6-dehydratase
MRIVVTGGLGFIGSAVVRHLIEHTTHTVLNIDLGTYAASEQAVAVAMASGGERYRFERADIVDGAAIDDLFDDFGPDGVIHLAAETHVDRSIDGPEAFVHTNVVGTLRLLESARRLVSAPRHTDPFRFLHVSTDEVFGALGSDERPFTEDSPYAPRSPYSASKASADHLVRAWNETYGLDVVITNCSNNYGPYQFPEKLVPLMITRALEARPLPVYGTGHNVRDWLFVEDHALALVAAFERGTSGDTYLIGGSNERTNLEVVRLICDLVDERAGRLPTGSRHQLIDFVDDRPGHDLRYAIDPSKASVGLQWSPTVDFEEGMARTVDWYFDNQDWWRPIMAARYDGSRLGICA